MDKTRNITNHIYINPINSNVIGFIKRQKKTNLYSYCLAMFGIAYAAAMTRVVLDQRAELKSIKRALNNHLNNHLDEEKK